MQWRQEKDQNPDAKAEVVEPAHKATVDNATAARVPAWADVSGGRLPAGLQAKLMVNQPGDEYEQEADRVAEQVMHTADGTSPAMRKDLSVMSKANGGEQATHEAPPIVNQALSSAGQPLDATTQETMGARFGTDFSHVRVHADEQAKDSAQAIHARAYTVGSDVVFGEGQYQPETSDGQRLIAHELTHVVQQSDGIGQETPSHLKLKTTASTKGVKRLQRAVFNVGSQAIDVNYDSIIWIPESDYVSAIETRFTSWTGSPATAIHRRLRALTSSQRRWVLFGLHLLMDNTTPAHSGLNRVEAVERIIARARSSTTTFATSSFDFENEVLRVSGWFEVALSAPLTAPTGTTLTTITGLYNPSPGRLDVARLKSELPPALTTLLRTYDPGRWAATGTQAIGPLQTIGDKIQDEARSVFSPYADTAIANQYSSGWRYSTHIFRVTSVTPTRDQRINYLLNRAEVAGRQSRSGGSIFSNANFDSSRPADLAILLEIVTRMEADPVIRAMTDRHIRHTGVTHRATNTVGLSTEFDLGTMTECDARWKSIRTLCHELIHVLVHPIFPDKASSIHFGQIVREGFTDALTVQLYNHLVGRASADPSFKAQMEIGLPGSCPAPSLTTVRYEQAGADAEHIRTLVGDDNFRAAYFLGAVNLVGLR